MKKTIAVILTLAMILAVSFSLVACNKDDGKLHISFYHTMGANLRAVLDEYVAEFEAMYSNVKVDSKQVGSYDDVRDQISTELQVGNQPNIAYCYPDHVALYNLAYAVEPLDSFIDSTDTVTLADGTTEIIGLTQEQKDDFIEGYYNEGRQFGDNKMYSMPFSKSTEVLYYNKTFFTKNNLPVPTHWWCTDECPADCNSSMEKVCEAIKAIDSKVTPLGYDSESNWFITMCEQQESAYTSATGTHFLFDNDENKAFVKRFAEWYQKGYVTTQEINGGYTSDRFKKQTSYMCIGSSAGAKHQVPEKANGKDYDFEAGIATIPQVNPANPKVISQGPSVCIFSNKDPEKVKYSWLLVKFLTTSIGFQADFSIASGYVPVIKSAATDPVYVAEMNKANGYANLMQLSAKVCLEQEQAYYASPAFYGSSYARDEVGQLIQSVLVNGAELNGDALMQYINQQFAKAIQNCRQKSQSN